MAIILSLTFPLCSNFRPVFLLIVVFRPLLSSQTTNRSICYLTCHTRFTYHPTLLPSFNHGRPQRRHIGNQAKDQPGSVVVQRVDNKLHPSRLDNYHERRQALNRTDKVISVPSLGGRSLYQWKLGIYQLLLRVPVTNIRRNSDNIFADSDTDSKSDSEPGDDDELDIRAHISYMRIYPGLRQVIQVTSDW